MIRLLLRRDQGTDNLIVPALISLCVAVLLRNVEVAGPSAPLFSPDNPGSLWFAHVFSGWALLLAGLIGSHFWIRAPRLYLALPLAPRTLWLTRMTAICIGCGMMLFMLALINGVSYETGRGLFIIGEVWLGALRLGSVFLLMLMLLQVPDPQRRKLATTAWFIAYTAILWCLGALLLLLGPRSPWLAAPMLIIALLIGRRTWRHLPRSFLLENTELDGTLLDDPLAPGHTEVFPAAPAPRKIGIFQRNGASRILLHQTLLRLMHNHWLGWLFICLLAIYGLVLSIHYYRGNDPLLALVYFFVFAHGSYNQSLVRIHPVDAWPIPRRLIFAHAMLPLIIPYLLGIGFGVLIEETRARPTLLIHDSEGRVEVPYEFHEIASDGVPTTINSPWGETHDPVGARLLPRGDAVVYNPYAVGEDNSKRFVALQIDRAVAAVYGGPAPDPLRYVEWEGDADDETIRNVPGFDLEAERGRSSEPRTKTFALLIALFTLLEIPLLLLSTLSVDRRALEWVRTKAVLIGVVVPFGAIAVLLASAAFSDTRLWAQAAWLMITLRRLAAALPLTGAQCWWCTALLVAIWYLVMQERFTKLEATLAMVKKKLQEDY